MSENVTLNEAIHCLCAYILKCCKDKKYQNITGQSFGAFKHHYRVQYDILKDNLQQDIHISNIFLCLTTLLEKCDNLVITGPVIDLLEDFVKLKPNFGCKGVPTESHVTCFNKYLLLVKEKYNISDPFVPITQLNIAETQNHSNIIETQLTGVITSTIESVNKDTNTNANTKTSQEKITQNICSNVGNKQSNDSVICMSTTNNALEHKKIMKKIRYNINRMLRKRNDIKIFEFHIANGTTPSSLFFANFPEPFLNTDDPFIENYNTIIVSTQTEIMKLSIKRLKEQILSIEERIHSLKSKIKENEETQKEIGQIYERESKFLEKAFMDADRKARSVVSRPFTAKKYNHVGKKNQNTMKKSEDQMRKTNKTPTTKTKNGEMKNRDMTTESRNFRKPNKSNNFEQQTTKKQHISKQQQQNNTHYDWKQMNNNKTSPFNYKKRNRTINGPYNRTKGFRMSHDTTKFQNDNSNGFLKNPRQNNNIARFQRRKPYNQTEFKGNSGQQSHVNNYSVRPSERPQQQYERPQQQYERPQQQYVPPQQQYEPPQQQSTQQNFGVQRTQAENLIYNPPVWPNYWNPYQGYNYINPCHNFNTNDVYHNSYCNNNLMQTANWQGRLWY
jgi:hypothetical protein